VEDAHSSTAEERLEEENANIWFTPLHLAECFHAMSRQIFERKLSQGAANAVFEALQHDVAGLWVHAAMPEGALDLCADLARRFGPKLGMKTLDTLHVACALELKAERFWTFDERQAKLAKAAGLKTTS
jgi:predicted nucleic acid-binding protein